MSYKIMCNGIVIAIFINEHDRDICMELLAEKYNDCEFTKFDD